MKLEEKIKKAFWDFLCGIVLIGFGMGIGYMAAIPKIYKAKKEKEMTRRAINVHMVYGYKIRKRMLGQLQKDLENPEKAKKDLETWERIEDELWNLWDRYYSTGNETVFSSGVGYQAYEDSIGGSQKNMP